MQLTVTEGVCCPLLGKPRYSSPVAVALFFDLCSISVILEQCLFITAAPIYLYVF